MAAISRLYISSDDLHAFVDEMLPPRAATRVASALEQDEAAHARVAAYIWQNDGLKQLYSEILEEPLPRPIVEMLTAARRNGTRGR